MSALLDVRDLQSGYGEMQVLWGVDLTVQPGETVILLGVNGAGKTTLLRTLVGLRPARAGTIAFDGLDVTALKPDMRIRRGMAFMSELGVFGALSIEENLRLGGYALGHAAARERAEAMYEMFPDLAAKGRATSAASLSGGQRKMLALAKALMSGARLILMDEPSAGLAPVFVKQVIATLTQVIGLGTSLVIAEQNIAFLSLADRGYLLDHGRMVATGTRAELEQNDVVRRAYFGVDAVG